jgi:Sec-independent protein secretion pathway component TatC
MNNLKSRWQKLTPTEKLFVGVIVILIVGILIRLPYIIEGVKHGIDIFFKNK